MQHPSSSVLPFGSCIGVTKPHGVAVFSCDATTAPPVPPDHHHRGVWTGVAFQCVELARRHWLVARGRVFAPVATATDLWWHVDATADGRPCGAGPTAGRAARLWWTRSSSGPPRGPSWERATWRWWSPSARAPWTWRSRTSTTGPGPRGSTIPTRSGSRGSEGGTGSGPVGCRSCGGAGGATRSGAPCPALASSVPCCPHLRHTRWPCEGFMLLVSAVVARIARPSSIQTRRRPWRGPWWLRTT